MNWILRRDSPGPHPEADIAGEMALLEDALAAPVLRLWQTRQCLVVTPLLERRAAFQQAADESQARGWPVVVRRTGGGPVPLTAGTLNVSIAYAMPRKAAHGLERAFHALADPIQATLSSLGIAGEIGEIAGSCCPGKFDLAIGGVKIAGIAQRRRQAIKDGEAATAILVHAMIWIEGGLGDGLDALEGFLDQAGAPTRFRRGVVGSLETVSKYRNTARDFGATLFEHSFNH